MFTMMTYGLNYGYQSYVNDTNYIGWWQNNTQGNWNCVCNNGLIMGSLALLGDDTSGISESLLGLTIPNALQNCIQAVTSDGTWTETPNYWYFGTTGHAEMTSSLLTAAGSDFGMLNTNPQFKETALFHMYVHGTTSLFDWGDSGPNKFSSTANAVIFYGEKYGEAAYQLYQRDMFDASEPWSMFWYDPAASGAFWDNLSLDYFFDNQLDQWASMRSSWTDVNALYVAMKAGLLLGHQTHNDLDCGDFVLDAMGTRWAGELGSGDYLSTGYFSTDAQDSQRWLYYRKRTEGQNSVLVNGQNQLVTATPTIRYDSSNTTQPGGTTVFTIPNGSAAFFTADLTSAYSNV
jgi:Heparinase II/III-like protein